MVVALRDQFPPATPDIDWIDALGRQGGWSVISGDLRIQRNKAERAVWMQTDLIGYFLEPGLARLPPIEQTARLLMRLATIEAQSRIVSGPAMFAVPLRTSSGLRQIRAV